jgi:hypothetical protein
MSLFEGLDVASAADDPFKIPPNTYSCTVTAVKVGPTKAGDKIGMTLVYTIQEGDFEGDDITEWKEIPQPADPRNLTKDESRALAWLKQRLLNLEIPEDRMNSVSDDDLVGLDVYVTTKEGKNGYTNVQKVELQG